MIGYNLEMAKLFIYNAKKSKSFPYCDISLFADEKNPLIMLGEIKLNIPENKKILQFIFDSFKKHYQILSIDSLVNNLELRLESALQKTNQELQVELIRRNKKEWLEKCSLLIGAMEEKMVHFTYLGDEMEIFLIRGNKIINVLNGRASNKINPLKIFTHITSGSLNGNDNLLFCNSALLDYFSQEKLRKVILSNPPEKACQYLKSLIITELESKTSVIAAIFKISSFKIKETLPPLPQEQEIEIEAKSSPLPMPQIISSPPIFKKWLEIFLNKLNFLLDFLKKIKSLAVKIAPFFKEKFSIKKLKEKIAVLKIKFKFLSPYHKIILLTCLFLFLLFAQSIAFLGGKQIAKKQQIEENKITMEIQDKQIDIEISLNYGDKEKAEKTALETKLMIQKLSSRTEKQKNLIKELEEKNQILLNKARDIFIAKPELIASLSSLKESFNPQKLFFSGQELYALDLESNIFSKTVLQNKETSFNEMPSEEKFKAAVLLDNENLLLVDAEGKLSKLNLKENSLTDYKINSEKEKEIRDAAIYQDKLYLLDIKNNQILKYKKIQNEFSEEANWLKEKMTLEDSTSFAIDGNVYLTKENGQILKLYKGKIENFNISNLKGEPIKEKIKVFTDLEMKFIYLLDSLNKRVVIINKENKTIEKQLKCEEFFAVNNLLILEKEKKIYLLSERNLFEIKI